MKDNCIIHMVNGKHFELHKNETKVKSPFSILNNLLIDCTFH